MEDLITPAEAARLRGVTRSAITDLVKRGRLQSVAVGGRPFLHRAEVERFTPEVTGRPPKSLPAPEKAATEAVKASNGRSTGKKKGGKK